MSHAAWRRLLSPSGGVKPRLNPETTLKTSYTFDFLSVPVRMTHAYFNWFA